MRPILIVAVVAACSPRAVTPSARTFVMDSPVGPDLGKSDAQFDVSKVGAMFGPSLTTGNGRLRHAVGPQVMIEGDAGILHVSNAGTGEDRNAYTGRVGAVWQSEDHHIAALAGLGGGTSRAAGSWGAGDVGFMIAGHQEHVRPVLETDIGYAAPFDSRKTFRVSDTDSTSTELRLPRNIVFKVSAGLEMGNADASLLIGLALVKFYRLESSVVNNDLATDDDTYLAAGIGIRMKID